MKSQKHDGAPGTSVAELAPPLRLRWTLQRASRVWGVGPNGEAIAYIGDRLAAISREGRTIWERRAQAWSPAVLTDGSILISDRRGLALLDPRTGGEVWRTPCPHAVYLTIPERDLCVTVVANVDKRWSRLGVASLPPAFSRRWETRVARDSSTQQVGVPLDFELASDGTRLFAMRRGDRKHEAEVLALSLDDGTELWRFPVHQVGWPAGLGKWRPAVNSRGHFLFRTDDWLACLDATTGRLLWKLEGGFGQLLVGQRVYLANRDRLRILRAEDGHVLLDAKLGRSGSAGGRTTRLTGRPAVSTSHVFALDETGSIRAFDRETGAPSWSFHAALHHRLHRQRATVHRSWAALRGDVRRRSETSWEPLLPRRRSIA
jgi:outer membrane protein assembly factor BamB